MVEWTMTNDEAEAMRVELCRHYGDQVLPVREVCDALFTWAKAAGTYLKETYGIEVDLQDLSLVTCKSSLLGRLIYGREKLRGKPCPVCLGVWRGCGVDCPCGGCGWLPNE